MSAVFCFFAKFEVLFFENSKVRHASPAVPSLPRRRKETGASKQLQNEVGSNRKENTSFLIFIFYFWEQKSLVLEKWCVFDKEKLRLEAS